MKEIKIVHCSDIHLDTAIKDMEGGLGEKVRRNIKTVFKKIIDICNEEKVRILLIAGDVFDNNKVKKETVSFVRDILEELENTYVFISPGNHDPFNGKSFYDIIDWPKNVYIFKGGLERIDLEDVSIHGFGFNEKYQRETLMKEINIKEDNINILVGHGDLGNRSSEYNPILLEDFEESGLDYIGLGHIHLYSGINRCGKTYYAYSGCPQGRGFDEEGEKGIVIGNVRKGFANLAFRKTSISEYETLNINVENAENLYFIEKLILKELEEKEKENFLKIRLIGNIKEDIIIDREILKENLNKYNVKIVDETRVKLDIKENSIKGMFIEELKKDENIDEEIFELALAFGMRSLSDEEIVLDDY
ncbi:MAG: metallophosphoesterase family protein [Clostridium sp.]|uniref:metallophosphoesterase family protein n=1 Tax=Clostridium sp. TaxID=1506 RepID=UPI003F306E49